MVRGAMLALVAGSLCGFLGACGGSGSNACQTAVTPEVCETPGNVRGVEPIQETSAPAPAPELSLPPAPLEDGRYALIASTVYCPAGYQPASEPPPAQWVLEISGCVLRISAASPDLALPYVSVSTFRYAAAGVLELTPACGEEVVPLPPRRYGFDGTTLQLSSSLARTGSDGQDYSCERIDTFELR